MGNRAPAALKIKARSLLLAPIQGTTFGDFKVERSLFNGLFDGDAQFITQEQEAFTKFQDILYTYQSALLDITSGSDLTKKRREALETGEKVFSTFERAVSAKLKRELGLGHRDAAQRLEADLENIQGMQLLARECLEAMDRTNALGAGRG